ncbi:MAG: glycoside hydrolase family 3 N-terminal domain-containing protein [Flavobacteriales bacterium]
MLRHLVIFSSLFLTAAACLHAQSEAQDCVPPVFLQQPTPWADSLIQQMTLDEKIGQLFMIAAWSDERHTSYDPNGVDMLIRKYGVGGIIFFQGGPGRQVNLTNRHQKNSKIPLLIGMDAEWGLGMRLDSTISYPRQLALGAAQDETLVYDFGREMARQLKRIGVHVSFSPVVDINNNPRNPVISSRSFGEDRQRVTRYSFQYMKGLQDGGVHANAKHFPGHGDTDTDSHQDLPVIPFDKKRLDSLELYPYHYLFNYGLSGVMIAHLYVPAIDDTPNTPSTLSRKMVTGLLREEMGFEGLVFTDALNMQGVTKFFRPGDADVQALIAGNDVILFPLNVAAAIERIKAAIAEGKLTEADITRKCHKVLRAKEWSGLAQWTPIPTANLKEDLQSFEAQYMRKRIVESSITVVRAEGSVAPICYSDTMKVALVVVGGGERTPFEETMARYSRFDTFRMEKTPGMAAGIALHDTLVQYDLVVAAMVGTSNRVSKNFGVTNESARILNAVGRKTGVVMCLFASPYSLLALKELDEIETIVVAYQDDALSQQVAAEVISGACTATGRLPVSTNPYFATGAGAMWADRTRLRWTSPGELGICTPDFTSFKDAVRNPERSIGSGTRMYTEDMMVNTARQVEMGEVNCFESVDRIAREGIEKKAYPGCRILAAWNGNVIYDKSFGHLNWDGVEPVNQQTVYDLASITKVASSTLAMMKLVDDGKVSLDKTLGEYLDIPSDNAYSKVVIRDMMSHTAGFKAWIPFYQETLDKGEWKQGVYTMEPDSLHQAQVAEGMYILNTYRDSIFQQILSTPISKDKGYLYSDLGYYFIQRIVEKQTGMSLDAFTTAQFYRPMGLLHTGYNPSGKMRKEQIAPTENDKLWRKQAVRGFVHDQGAAMMGGVAGHAGLFSTAQELAIIMQMLMNGGTYGGTRYLSKEVIDTFNTRYYPGNRRGVGFDKPALKGGGSACSEATDSSFGHTGFTGTMCWADPDTGIVFVFLSNRVNPDAENKLLQTLDIRTRIQTEFYKALEGLNRGAQ